MFASVLRVFAIIFTPDSRRAVRTAQANWRKAVAAYHAAKARDDRRGMGDASKAARAAVHPCLRAEMGRRA